jgi:CIC family chloride channel protein
MINLSQRISPYKRLVLIATIIGVISGFGALLFYEGLKIAMAFFWGDLLGYVYPREGESIAQIAQWSLPSSLIILIPILLFGGLVSGILLARLAPEAEGDGTDAAIHAFHTDGTIRKRIPVLKAVTSIITISTGGSAGREGPAAQISAGFGSLVADMLGLSPKERHIALATGIGAGIGTIFKAPLGGAVLAAEVLYSRDFESEAIIPAFLASIIGYAIFGFFEGYTPLFALTAISWTIPQLPFFLVLGVFCSAFGVLYISTFYWTQEKFNDLSSRYHIPPYLKPASGALLLGIFVIALAGISPDAEILGFGGLGAGYGFTQLIIYSMVPLAVLLLLPFVKILTTSLTLGSGGSGGVFGPGLAIGASVGGAIGVLLHLLMPALVPADAVSAFVIVGMIALFGAIANAPIAVLIMVVEMVGSFTLLVPAMGAVAVSKLILGDTTIFRAQVPTKAQSNAHRGEYNRETLEGIFVRDVMTPRDKVITLAPADDPDKVFGYVASTSHTGFPVLENERLAGIIDITDIRNSKKEEGTCPTIGDMMTKAVVVVRPEDTLETALGLMVARNINHLPVVTKDNPDRLAGFITRTDILQAYARFSKHITCEPSPEAGGKL